MPDRLARARANTFAHLRMHRQVGVALAVPDLGVREAAE